ncbi:MAG: SUMF1/EgtB/PvdO family nonheme iron enzyme [Spirochaetales bacterium]|nr:SUMF1/EgtB/PvdO family nonheme iron enzyme [Spirochaetales bacterium]
MIYFGKKKNAGKENQLEEFEFETVILNEKGEVIEKITSHASMLVELLSSGLTIEMVFITGGTFTMGESIGLSFKENKPVHQVSVPSFYLGKYPVTREQYKYVIGKLPPGCESCDKRPVERVSWFPDSFIRVIFISINLVSGPLS